MGSPPRGRGKAVSRTSWRAACGITPAWAGKSSPAGLQCWCRGDHPRVGGEKAVTQTVSKGQVGSPPRGRGKVGAAIMKYTVSGITPAWAGKSMIWLRLSFGCMDHPRVGGEKLQGEVNRQLEAGSPPRGRGKVYSVYREVCYGGITPAWAGKSPGPPGSGLFWGDHPRVGGEKYKLWLDKRACKGSPPRGRGKDAITNAFSRSSRITPAWAGKRSGHYPCYPQGQDHPRVGGEKISSMFKRSSSMGSPPRGRGKAVGDYSKEITVGITPAWAGKRSCSKTLNCFG